jgi:ABC-type nitrate/sulfonate/bicarbonate transport system ATPase subunit
MLSIQNVSFGFSSDKMVLNNLNLKSYENKTIAIVGASGCGKSTFLRLLCGILPNHKRNCIEGKILVDDVFPVEYTKQGKVGFMFQDATLFPNLTVRENIALRLKLRGENDKEMIDHLVETVGLSEYSGYLPKALSGGMKTRVALARTFATKPQLLLLDEPFSALDIRWKFCLYQELEKLRQEYSPMTVIVTHDIQEALLLSNHILVLGTNGTVLKEMQISKPLPRVFETDAIKYLQEEYLEIQKLIMHD